MPEHQNVNAVRLPQRNTNPQNNFVSGFYKAEIWQWASENKYCMYQII